MEHNHLLADLWDINTFDDIVCRRICGFITWGQDTRASRLFRLEPCIRRHMADDVRRLVAITSLILCGSFWNHREFLEESKTRQRTSRRRQCRYATCLASDVRQKKINSRDPRRWGKAKMSTELPHIFWEIIGKALIFSLLHAVFLRAASWWINKVKVPFGKAYGYCFLIAVVGGMVATIIGTAITHLPLSMSAIIAIAWAATLILLLPLSTGIYGTAIKNDTGKPIGFKKGFLTSITQFGLAAAIMALLFGIILLGARMR